MLNPFENKCWFLCVHSTSLLKTLWEKEKLLVTSNFSLSHCVFYLFGEFSVIFIKFETAICKLFQFGRIQNLLFGKGFCQSMGNIIFVLKELALRVPVKTVLTFEANVDKDQTPKIVVFSLIQVIYYADNFWQKKNCHGVKISVLSFRLKMSFFIYVALEGLTLSQLPLK